MANERQFPEMNETLLISSAHQHELTEQAPNAEAALRDSEQRFRTLFELGPVAVYSCDASGVIQQFNRRAAELWGREPAIGDTAERFSGSFRLIRPDGSVLAHEQCPMAEVLSGSIPHARDAEVSIERPDGSRVTVAVNIRPLKNEQGEITGAINCFYDITQRKHMEQALRESEERFRTLADNISQFAWTADAKGWIYWYNQRWFDYTDTTLEEMQGWGWKKVHHPDHVDRVVDRIQRSWDTGEPWEDTFPLRGKDGEYRWFLSRALPIRDEQGDIVRWFGTNTDITDQRRAIAEADEANRAKDVFLAMLSHEMRSPLSAIVGWMQILQGGTAGGCTDEELNEGLDVIERNARTLVQLLDDVLDVSRIVSGKMRLEVRPCDLSKVIRAGIDVVRSAAQAKDIAISAELDPAACAASCDTTRMQQVVWNLLSNAVKFTPKGGTVRVTLAREPSDVHIQVIDSGQGIAPELLPYVFDRFRQADSSSRRHFGGLGLGLAIVKQLVELHGGTVQVESAGLGQGSTFSVSLPIRAVRTGESGEEPATGDSQPLAPTELPLVRLDGLRVLVVDDEADARRLLVKVLQEAGAVVTAAASAAEAIDALQTANPEVLVSDLGMPDQDGFDLIRQVRASGHLVKDLPAVALSAFVRQQDRRKSVLAGFQMHIPKPADPHDLTAALASLTGRT